MRKCVNRIFLTLLATGALLAADTLVFAHGIDERPGLGKAVTAVLSIVWIIIVLGIVFFVRRLTRRGASKDKGTRREPERNTNEPE